MVRSRFAALPTAQQQTILHAAMTEFATNGFHDASLNRVIDAAGISKGSMYYYFEGKDDLYVYCVRTGFEELFSGVGPFDVPSDGDADVFWSTVEAYYLRLMTALNASPQLAALIRGWIAASATPALQRAQQELARPVLPWLEQTLAAGQRIGAVRSDLPTGLLIAVITGMGEAMDTWLITQQPHDGELAPLITALIGMIRRAIQP